MSAGDQWPARGAPDVPALSFPFRFRFRTCPPTLPWNEDRNPADLKTAVSQIRGHLDRSPASLALSPG